MQADAGDEQKGIFRVWSTTLSDRSTFPFPETIAPSYISYYPPLPESAQAALAGQTRRSLAMFYRSDPRAADARVDSAVGRHVTLACDAQNAQTHTMKRVLVLYATREGQTRKIATRVAMHLQNFGADVQLIDAADATAADAIELVDFDLLVFGASMHAGGLEREMVDYVNRNRAQIEMRPRSFFLVLLSAAAENPQLRESWLGDARQKLKQQLSVGFADTQMIAGALLYSKYSLPVRWFMKRIASKAGGATDTSKDYEYTNWQQVARYAQRLSKALALSTG